MRSYYWLLGVGLLIVFGAVYLGIAAYVTSGSHLRDWPNWQRGYEPQSQIDDYGEKSAQNLWDPRPPARLSAIQQPWCFWSALAFSLAGLLTLLWLDCTMRGVTPRSMAVPSWVSVPLGLLMVWMGPASMLEHGTLRSFLGWFDSASIHWYGIYILGYVILRFIPGATDSWVGRGIYWAVAGAAIIAVGILSGIVGESRLPITIISLVVMGLLLLADAIRDNIVRARTARFDFGRFMEWNWRILAAVVSTGLAFLFLGLSSKGGPFAAFGHGVWHICIAAVTFFIYLHLRQQEIETGV